MTPTVHILATCRNLALLDATRLVFKTLRVGFPTARIVVYSNGMCNDAADEVRRDVAGVNGAWTVLKQMSHDAWIEQMIQFHEEPFWICDTDMVFFESVEGWYRLDSRTELAGRFEPEFLEEYTKTVHVARLHTCLMYINPQLLRVKMREWMGQFPQLFGSTAQMHLVRQSFVPVRCHPHLTGDWPDRPLAAKGSGVEWVTDWPLFYDTCAGLYQAGIGQPFNEHQDRAFEHLHCGTYSDLVAPHLTLPDLGGAHRRIFTEPALARGIKQQQDKYYASRRPGIDRTQTERGYRAQKGDLCLAHRRQS